MQKTTTHFTLAGKLVAALSLWMACGVSFAVQTWDGSGLVNLGTLCGNSGSATTCGDSSTTGLTVGGFSTQSGSSITNNFSSATVYNEVAGNSKGLGVVASGESTTSGIDNNAGTDALLLNFTFATNLTGIKLGWVNGDSDFTVFAWQGAGAPILTSSGPSSLLSGWTHIGNYFDVGVTSGKTATITSSVFSSYWLISAYNSAYNRAGEPNDTTTDAFKVLAISASANTQSLRTSNVPEPGSLVLIGAAFMGMLAVRRKQNPSLA